MTYSVIKELEMPIGKVLFCHIYLHIYILSKQKIVELMVQ